MLNSNPDTGIDSILNTESTSLVEIPDLPNFGSLFGFDNRLKALEQGFSEFIQTNQYATALSSIPNIIDNYLGLKLKEAVDVAVQLKSDRIREEAQAENEDFFNKVDENMMKIIKEQNLYKALVNVYEADKALLDAYGDTVTIKRRRYNADDDQEPSAGTDRGSKRRRAGKEPESFSAPREKTSTTIGKSTEGSKSHQQSAGQSAPAEVPMHTADDFEDPTYQEFDTRLNDDQPEEEAHPHPDWFQQPSRLPSPDRDWNKTVPADHGPIQPWLSNLARQEDPQESFDELIDTPLDFSAFMMNRLKGDTLTPELLAGPTFKLMKGT
ncbi:hypothetical protein Tco_0826190, partial [Tanacetum coccineum]